LIGLPLLAADSQSISDKVANSIHATGIDARQSRRNVVLMYRFATSTMFVIILPLSTMPKKNRRMRSKRKNESTSISIGAATTKKIQIIRTCFPTVWELHSYLEPVGAGPQKPDSTVKKAIRRGVTKIE
jgi:hypothetical protein